MELTERKKQISLVLLSIIVPMSLLGTFRLTGILKEPTKVAETITLETIEWEFERINQSADIFYVVEALHDDNGFAVNQRIHIWDYVNRPLAWSGSTITMVVELNSNTTSQNGYIESVYVALYKDQLSTVDWVRPLSRFGNLSIVEQAVGYEWSTKADLRLTSVKHSRSVKFSAMVVWSLLTPNNQSHQMDVLYELIYYNGTAYKKITQPFQLKVMGR